MFRIVSRSILVLFVAVLATALTAPAQVRLASSSDTDATIIGDRYTVHLQFAPNPRITLRITSTMTAEAAEVGSFPLEGYAESAEGTGNDPLRFVSATTNKTGDGYAFTLRYRSAKQDEHDVTLQFHPSFFSYALTVMKGFSREITALYYLARAGNNRQIEYGEGRFEQVHTWTADLYDALIPDVGLSRLSLSTHGGMEDPGYLRGQQAGSPLVSPYVIGIRSGHVWWGVGTIGIPSTYSGIGFVIGQKSFGVTYQTASQPSAQATTVRGPVAGFYFGSNPEDVLRNYRTSLPPARPLSDPSASPKWWSQPIYCSWGDQAYAARMREGRLDEGNGSHYATEKDIDVWLAIAEREKLPIGTVILDLGWMWGYGDFEPNPKHFSDLRTYIDKLHAKGLHVLLWMPMYEATGALFNLDKQKSDVASKHPDWLVHTRDGKLTDLFDYTHPGTREYVHSRIHNMLSSAPGGLNADGLKVDFMDRLPNPAVSAFHDPSWAIGELMAAKVLELIYSSAKEAKPDAMIDSSFMNPLFQEWQDVIRLNDDVSNAVETYWWRAWAASVNGVHLIDGDDWWAMERYFVPLTLAKSAWGIPNIYAVQYRGNLGSEATINGLKSIASGGYPVDISEDSFLRVRSILDVYRHAPADNTQQPDVNPILQHAGRLYRAGPLKGFLAAQTLNFGHVLVTYSPQSAWLTSISDTNVLVPLPKGYVVRTVSAVQFDGSSHSVPFQKSTDGISLAVQDSAKGSDHYVIEYFNQQ
jgi:hypothetical protein